MDKMTNTFDAHHCEEEDPVFLFREILWTGLNLLRKRSVDLDVIHNEIIASTAGGPQPNTPSAVISWFEPIARRSLGGDATKRLLDVLTPLLNPRSADFEHIKNQWMSYYSCGYPLMGIAALPSERLFDIRLINATLKGNTAEAESLIAEGIDINVYNRNGATALMHAVARNEFDLVETLAQAGARLDHQDATGRTALFIACQYDRVDALEILLDHGANPSLQTYDGDYPVHRALINYSDASLRRLVAAGANLDGLNMEGASPLLTAIRRRDSDYITLLVESGASVDLNGEQFQRYLDPEVKSIIQAAAERRQLSTELFQADTYTSVESEGLIL